jgi:hypothetical protein
MVRPARPAVALLALVVAAACTPQPSGTTSPEPTRSVATPTGPIPHDETSAPTLRGAIRSLCDAPTPPAGQPVEPGDLPAEIERTIGLVEQTRGLTFREPVAAEGITDEVMDRKLEENFELYYPEEPLARRSAAWRTLGVIPPDADLRESLRAFMTGQVVGFYDPATGELVYLGDGTDLGLTERQVLAHELTHALDDQWFDLERLDALIVSCRDEAFQAALGLVEGSAQYFSIQAVVSDPDLDLGDIAAGLLEAVSAGGGLEGVPPFVQELQTWPYIDGPTFVAALAKDGTQAVDAAFRRPPTTTEQVMHPETYPGERPRQIQIPDLAMAVGPGWGDLDAMVVGEQWLRAMLALRLDRDQAADAAAGWDGAAYRAWSDGRDAIVALQTAWDSPADADAFAQALTAWVGERDTASIVRVGEDQVTLVTATDPQLVIDTDNDDAEGG